MLRICKAFAAVALVETDDDADEAGSTFSGDDDVESLESSRLFVDVVDVLFDSPPPLICGVL